MTRPPLRVAPGDFVAVKADPDKANTELILCEVKATFRGSCIDVLPLCEDNPSNKPNLHALGRGLYYVENCWVAFASFQEEQFEELQSSFDWYIKAQIDREQSHANFMKLLQEAFVVSVSRITGKEPLIIE